jgi:3-hydroxymyristoyl/3-hydroxydecanoyl-(acyl carrier protein) dehydratase
MSALTLTIDAEHPALAGHFPGAPILPGVLLLDEIVRALEADGATLAPGHWSISTAKFVQPVRPGETLTFGHERLPNGSIRFNVSRGGQRVAHGVLVPHEQQVR